ncbi:MAG: tripartite tricarboxylate transporter permease [Rhodospirillales bacterium]|nr:tripartite tricarboxylate transporter permease [Rhodospirillales bacterium]
MYDTILAGMAQAFSIECILLIASGVTIGIIFGAIPGLTASMALILCLPLTFTMTPINGVSLLCGLFIGGISGGLIPAILLKIPGTPGSVATLFDGYPMAMKGQAHKALGAGILFSFLGTLFGIAVLVFCAPMLAEFALRFTPFEYFAVTFFALTLIASLSSGSMLKGFISGLIGIAFGMIGMSPVGGIQRFTAGTVELQGGFEMVPFLVGLFAVSELFHNCAQGFIPLAMDNGKVVLRGFGISLKEFVGNLKTYGVSSTVGTIIGILPGIGVSTASIMGYLAAKKTSKHPEKFGTGIVDGIVASESANNACIGGALVPLLALGIPGDTVAAILLGALVMNNLQPGPLLFMTQGTLVYGIFTSLVIASFCMLVIELFLIRFFTRLIQTPKNILMPLVIVMCMVGAFGVNNRAFDVWSVLLFGGLGYALHVFKFPLQPAVLGFILGNIVEMNFYRALMASKGDYLPFITRPISAFFVIIGVLFIVYPLVRPLLFKLRKPRIQSES